VICEDYGNDANIFLSREIQLAVDYINEHYASSLTRQSVAAACYLSANYFSTQFRQEMGICFRDYLIRVRILKSAELLQSEIPIRDIAFRVGYRSRNRYIINFRQELGCTPSEYRKKLCI
jgi:AraC-like DNA-binding protein